MDLSAIHTQLNGIEGQIKLFHDTAAAEIKNLGKLSSDTQNALDALGNKQKVLADEILLLKQKASDPGAETKQSSIGEQFVKSSSYASFIAGSHPKARFECKNTLTGSDTVRAPDRRAEIVPGAAQPLTMEAFLTHIPTTAGAIEYTRETAFTNNAAAVAEGASKPESVLTFSLETMPISTIAHFVKISKQLAADAPALAAYVDQRMKFGVNLKVETQLVVGDGVSPNLSGFMKSGNYTAHGIANADLGSVHKKLVLIRTMIANLTAAGFPPDAIVLNPADWAAIEIGLFTVAAGQTLYSVNEAGRPMLFGLPVVQSIGMAADTVAVGNFAQAATIYDREGVVVEMSESDGDNFTKNLITVRAERRLALVIERPAAIQAGDLTPA